MVILILLLFLLLLLFLTPSSPIFYSFSPYFFSSSFFSFSSYMRTLCSVNTRSNLYAYANFRVAKFHGYYDEYIHVKISLAKKGGSAPCKKIDFCNSAKLPFHFMIILNEHMNRWEERRSCLAKLSPTLERSLNAAWDGMNQYWQTRGRYIIVIDRH